MELHHRTHVAKIGIYSCAGPYQFKSLVHPARDIATKIADADPGGNKLPARLRGWNLDTTDELQRRQRIHLTKLLGMIIHVYYLRIGDGVLDVSNDEGKRVIVPYGNFVDYVERLVLTRDDTCLVICGLAEEKLKNGHTMQALSGLTPGSGDLQHCLATITTWPALQESIWTTFFAEYSTTVETGCQTINEVPFVKGARRTGTIVLWCIGWRRNDAYAEQWIDISQLIGSIRAYFAATRPR